MGHQQQMAHPPQSTRPSNPPNSTISQPSTTGIFNQAQRDHPEQQTTMRQISAPQPADVQKTPVNVATKITVQRTPKASNNSINNIPVVDSEKKFKEGSIYKSY